MADTKISALPASTTPLAGTEVLPIVQSSSTVQVSVANLTAGRAVATGALTVTGTLSATGNITSTTGNVVIGTAGNGIDFSATSSGSGTMTSELLADYEEGTWTPTQGAGLTVVGAFTSSGTYTKIGRVVTFYGSVSGATSIAVTAGTIICSGLPFSCGSSGLGVSCNANNTVTATNYVGSGGTTLYSNTAITATSIIEFSATYQV